MINFESFKSKILYPLRGVPEPKVPLGDFITLDLAPPKGGSRIKHFVSYQNRSSKAAPVPP